MTTPTGVLLTLTSSWSLSQLRCGGMRGWSRFWWPESLAFSSPRLHLHRSSSKCGMILYLRTGWPTCLLIFPSRMMGSDPQPQSCLGLPHYWGRGGGVRGHQLCRLQHGSSVGPPHYWGGGEGGVQEPGHLYHGVSGVSPIQAGHWQAPPAAGQIWGGCKNCSKFEIENKRYYYPSVETSACSELRLA